MSVQQRLGAEAHWVVPADELEYVLRNGKWVSELGVRGCQARVVRFAAGDEIELHHHTGTNVKIVLSGAISFENEDGPLGVAEGGTIYWCGTGIYRGTVLHDTYLLVVEEEGSDAVAI